jgi:hypothetical protein
LDEWWELNLKEQIITNEWKEIVFRMDDRIIRTDWDAGFVEGRQYGRGKSGGQVGTICRERIRIQSGQWIRNRIRNPDLDPGGQKRPTKVEKI